MLAQDADVLVENSKPTKKELTLWISGTNGVEGLTNENLVTLPFCRVKDTFLVCNEFSAAEQQKVICKNLCLLCSSKV